MKVDRNYSTTKTACRQTTAFLQGALSSFSEVSNMITAGTLSRIDEEKMKQIWLFLIQTHQLPYKLLPSGNLAFFISMEQIVEDSYPRYSFKEILEAAGNFGLLPCPEKEMGSIVNIITEESILKEVMVVVSEDQIVGFSQGEFTRRMNILGDDRTDEEKFFKAETFAFWAPGIYKILNP